MKNIVTFLVCILPLACFAVQIIPEAPRSYKNQEEYNRAIERSNRQAAEEEERRETKRYHDEQLRLQRETLRIEQEKQRMRRGY
jgi:hypothetical protein